MCVAECGSLSTVMWPHSKEAEVLLLSAFAICECDFHMCNSYLSSIFLLSRTVSVVTIDMK